MKDPVPKIDDSLSVNIVNNLHMLFVGTIFFGRRPAFFGYPNRGGSLFVMTGSEKPRVTACYGEI